ncbi:GNAT family N-acetyltransferase [Sphingomonas sp. AX6]|uniref:GNAT family N-acetyltransferase n=1 Tax=Sphingomonas sp. AX6 TaxID=2653171 RepID=UPI0012F3F70D|nr:GNAT family protein [Sphingomonas sp. AX6]VXC73506.1 GNAT family N-acetyltransferase [Sphingomonas sp. AX6]
MRDTPRLESARLVLRLLSPDDADALHPTFADEALMTWWSSAAQKDVEETRAYLAQEGRADAMQWRGWAIVERGESDEAIGFVSTGERRADVSEIGYMLARSHWGRGIAAEAVGRVIEHLFDAEGQRRVFADTDPDNLGSRALLERLGFQLEGTLRGEWETHIGVRDSVIYGLLKDEWAARRR